MKNMNVLAIVAATGLVSAASAAIYSVDFDIENFGGDAAGVIINFDFDLEAIAGAQIASVNWISIELSHSWGADITFSVSNADGTFDMLDGDQGGDGNFGDGGSLLSGTSTYTFFSGGTANGLLSGGLDLPIAGGDYDANSWVNGPFGSGMWNIFLEDDYMLDDGAVGTIAIDYNVVPAPSALALLGLGGIVAGRRRR